MEKTRTKIYENRGGGTEKTGFLKGLKKSRDIYEEDIFAYQIEKEHELRNDIEGEEKE